MAGKPGLTKLAVFAAAVMIMCLLILYIITPINKRDGFQVLGFVDGHHYHAASSTEWETAINDSFQVLGFVDGHHYLAASDTERETARRRVVTALTELWIFLKQVVIPVLRNVTSQIRDVLKAVDGLCEDTAGYQKEIMSVLSVFNDLDKTDFASQTVTADSHPLRAQRETARRRVETMVREMWYLLDAGMTQLKQVASSNTDALKVVSGLSKNLERHHMAVHRALFSLRNGSGDEDWRAAESRRLGNLVQRRIDFIQNPKDCNNTKQIVCDLSQICGFGCKLHHAVYCLQFAYATNRTLVLDSRNMHYKSKNGWNTYFQPMSKTCNTASKRPVNWNDAAAKAPGLKGDGPFSIGNFTTVLKATPVIWLPPLFNLHHRPDFLHLAIPEDLAPRLSVFHGEPEVWWVGQFLWYVMRPNSELTQLMIDAARRLSFKQPVVGLHVRRTDKLKFEATMHSLEEYMGHVENYFRRNHVTGSTRRVYLASDDPTVLKEAQQKFPNYTYISDNEISKIAASLQSRFEADSLRGVIMDILFLSMTDYLVCTFSSNICRAAYALMQTRFGDASTFYRSLDDVFFCYGQNPHNLIAIKNHQARSASELSIQVGDLLKSRGNHWEAEQGTEVNYRGFVDAYNWRTGEIGVFPSYKAEYVKVAAKMQTYPEVKEKTDWSRIMDEDVLDFVKDRNTTSAAAPKT